MTILSFVILGVREARFPCLGQRRVHRLSRLACLKNLIVTNSISIEVRAGDPRIL